MTNKTQRIKSIKSKVETIWKNPKSHSLENHYKFMRMILQKEYPKTFENISPETIETIIQDTMYTCSSKKLTNLLLIYVNTNETARRI